ncbi:MAG: hypothetical protein Q4C89_01415 [Deinococcus sp.]|uniref:hypothetical protein n=1 Tax=Deinococcus sp. TaxID=47478 RepID=UPI0026DDC868|nr:hypothetical protein [Deinococcus sp.]MDO4244667.1 hypothetical protein [Deinococcus sp.]
MTRRNRVTRLEALEAKARARAADREAAAGLNLRARLSSPVPEGWRVISGAGVVLALPPNGREAGPA